MLANAKLIAFVATTQPQVARQFYEEVLGLRLLANEPSALVFAAGEASLRISKVKEFTPAPYTVLGWQVSSIHAYARQLAERGVEPERFEGMPQNEEGICAFPDGTLVLWFRDADGNLISLTQLERTVEPPQDRPPAIA